MQLEADTDPLAIDRLAMPVPTAPAERPTGWILAILASIVVLVDVACLVLVVFVARGISAVRARLRRWSQPAG